MKLLTRKKGLDSAEFQKIMKEYYKKDSKHPDFTEPLFKKLKREEPVSTVHILDIMGIISTVDDKDLKLCLLEKITEEIVLKLVEWS